MRCPKCRGELGELEVDLVKLDFCSGCKGTWFDSGEIGAYFELSRDFPVQPEATGAPNPDCPCPRCETGLQELRYASPADLLVDHCGSCDGVFLDRGEIGKLQQLSNQLERPSVRIAAAAKYLESHGYEIIGSSET